MYKSSTTLRYFTNENGKHYTAVVLKDQTILSLKVAGEKDKTIYDSFDEWLLSLPENATVSDLDIKEREYVPKPPFKVPAYDTITLKDIAPTYDLLRFLLTYEAFSLKNSLYNIAKKFQTKTYVMDADSNLHPVKYNRSMGKLYSEYHKKMGTTLEEIGFPVDAEIYVMVPGVYYGLSQLSPSLERAEFPFSYKNYQEFYTAKFAFVATPINRFWNMDYTFYSSICGSLKDKGYYVYSRFFQYHSNKDSILFSKKFKTFEGNLAVVEPSFNEIYIYKYNPIGCYKIPFSSVIEELNKELNKELKSII
jgi:hypothetical protein